MRQCYNNLPDSCKRQLKKFLRNAEEHNYKKINSVFWPLDSAWCEAVFAPFHDPEVADTLKVNLIPRSSKKCKLTHFWCWTLLSWEEALPGMLAASLYLKTDIDTTSYNYLLLCITMPKDVEMQVCYKLNETWCGPFGYFPGKGIRMEVKVPITKGRLTKLKLDFKANGQGPRGVYLSWFGLQNSILLNSVISQKKSFDPSWPGLIKDPDTWKDVKFSLGLLFDERDIDHLRKKKELPVWSDHFEFLEEKAKEYLSREPERDLGDYLPVNDTRFLRDREHGKTPYYFEALVLAFVGLTKDDIQYTMHALRYLMCMLHTRYWTQSAESRIPGSTWDQRCFLEELTTTSVSLLADWLDFALTDRARHLIVQTIWDKGLSIIERDLMKYVYVQHINQGSVFCRARILGGLHLERSWPNVTDYVDRAFKEMTSNLSKYIESDGGMHEGIGYFCQTLQAVLPSMIAYARSRRLRPSSLIKKYFSNCEDYLKTMSSTTPGKAIPTGDCRTDSFCGDGIPILARFFPGSAFEKILRPCIDTHNIFKVTGTLTNSGGITGFIYGPDHIPEPSCVVPTFSILKKTGHMASLRQKDGHSTRIHLVGSKPNPSHSHLDKGSIILELDAIPILIDRGMVEYYFAESYELKRSYMHNVLTPLNNDGTFADQLPPTKPIIPKGKGDGFRLKVKINLSNVWRHVMDYHVRELHSDTPEELKIIDIGRLLNRRCVVFHLHSRFPFNIKDNNNITINAERYLLNIRAEWATKAEVKKYLIDLSHTPCYHLALYSQPLKEFKISTKLNWVFQ